MSQLSEGEVLKNYMKENKISVAKMAEKLDVSDQAIYDQLKRNKIALSFKQRLSDAGYKVNFNTPSKLDNNKSNAEKIELSSGIMKVPLVTQYAYGGYLGGYSDPEFMEGLPTVPFIVDREYKGIYMAFEVRGESMIDGSFESFLEGDIVLCREVGRQHWKNKLHLKRWKDFVIVHKTDGILIKRITEHDIIDGHIIAHSLNPEYEDLKINLDDIEQLFNVIKVDRAR